MPPVQLFDAQKTLGGKVSRRFDVSLDGQHFAVVGRETNPENGDAEPVVRIIPNWVETWRDQLPAR